MTAATGALSAGEVADLFADSSWTVYQGTAPANVQPPFISLHLDSPVQFAAGLSGDDWGQMHDRWRLQLFGQNVDQVRWMFTQLCRRELGPLWVFEATSPPLLDPNAQPDTWFMSVILRSMAVC